VAEDRPLVSVVTTTWNAADYLRETLQSVFDQTYSPIEVVVVDDGSTDHTREVVESFGGRVRYIRQDKDDKGGSTAIPKAYAAARGKYLATLDHDDLWTPEKIERQVAAMEADPALGAVFTRFRIVDGQGADQGASPLVGPSGDVFHALLAGNLYCYSSALFRRDVFETIGPQRPFDDGVGLGDWDLWLRIARHFPVRLLDEELTRYRVHRRGYSADLARMGQATLNVLARRRGDVHPGCPECEKALATARGRASVAFLGAFHAKARGGDLKGGLPALRTAVGTSASTVSRPESLAALAKSFVVGALRPRPGGG